VSRCTPHFGPPLSPPEEKELPDPPPALCWHFEDADGFEDYASSPVEAQSIFATYLEGGKLFTVRTELVP
jgi:hypothetical protein